MHDNYDILILKLRLLKWIKYTNVNWWSDTQKYNFFFLIKQLNYKMYVHGSIINMNNSAFNFN